MKIFKILAVALVATLGFTACNKECGHDFIEYDHSEALIGTWTYIAENGQAEAMVINPDGSFTTTGVTKGGSMYEEKGTIKVVNNKVSLVFEGDTEAIEGRLELVAGKSMSIVINEQYGVRLDYDYCKEDLSEEVVGMWVCTQTNLPETNMTIQTYQEDGKSIFTGFSPNSDSFMANLESTYNVVGDMMFQKTGDRYFATRLTYSPNGNSLGDILTTTSTILVNGESVTSSYSFLRIKQYLELPSMKYDYIKTFVSNVKGEDKDIPFLNTSFNFAKMDGGIIDKFLKSILFTVEFPDANTIAYNFLLEGQNFPMTAPIEVDGNKMTIKMSANNPAYHDIDVYTFQDQDNTQMHMYMHTTAFEKFFANTSVAVMLGHGQLSQDDTEAIAAVYQTIAEAVESINLSLVMSKSAK